MQENFYKAVTKTTSRIIYIDDAQRLCIDSGNGSIIYPLNVPVLCASAALGQNGTIFILSITLTGRLLLTTADTAMKLKHTTLSRTSGPSELLSSPIICCTGTDLFICYKIASGSKVNLILYKNTANRWDGMSLYEGSADESPELWDIAVINGKCCVFYSCLKNNQIYVYKCFAEDRAAISTIASIPPPLTELYILPQADGSIHTCWISGGRTFADSTPLTASRDCFLPIIYELGNDIICCWMQNDGAHAVYLSAEGWRPYDLPAMRGRPKRLFMLRPAGKQLVWQVTSASGHRNTAVPQDLPSTTQQNGDITQVVYNQAILIRELSNEEKIITRKLNMLEKQVEFLTHKLISLGKTQPKEKAPDNSGANNTEVMQDSDDRAYLPEADE